MILHQMMTTISGSQTMLGCLLSPSLQSPTSATPRYHVQPTSSYREAPYSARRDSPAEAVLNAPTSFHRSSSSVAASDKRRTSNLVSKCAQLCSRIPSSVQRASHAHMFAALAQSRGHRRRGRRLTATAKGAAASGKAAPTWTNSRSTLCGRLTSNETRGT